MPSDVSAPSIALPCGSRTPDFKVTVTRAFIGDPAGRGGPALSVRRRGLSSWRLSPRGTRAETFHGPLPYLRSVSTRHGRRHAHEAHVQAVRSRPADARRGARCAPRTPRTRMSVARRCSRTRPSSRTP
jgi:hypothetical protein